jgi:endoglucanase
MIEAHMDEIGLMVKYVDEKGFIRFIRIGGWFDQTLLTRG